MKKTSKLITIILLGISFLLLIGFIGIICYWNGAFDAFRVREIASYESPDGNYTLRYQAVGDPQWPFGPAKIRLILQNKSGKKLQTYHTKIYDDGAQAGKWNLSSVTWQEDCVVIIVQASEQPDETVILPFRKQ